MKTSAYNFIHSVGSMFGAGRFPGLAC